MTVYKVARLVLVVTKPRPFFVLPGEFSTKPLLRLMYCRQAVPHKACKNLLDMRIQIIFYFMRPQIWSQNNNNYIHIHIYIFK